MELETSLKNIIKSWLGNNEFTFAIEADSPEQAIDKSITKLCKKIRDTKIEILTKERFEQQEKTHDGYVFHSDIGAYCIFYGEVWVQNELWRTWYKQEVSEAKDRDLDLETECELLYKKHTLFELDCVNRNL